MIQEASPGPEAGNSEQRFSQPLRHWEWLVLLLIAAGILLGAVIESRKEYLGNDELITAILVANPSFSEMMGAIRRGGELNPPLFFILEWVIVRGFGVAELALRAIPGICIAWGSWVLYFCLRPLTGPRSAAIAIALVLGLSRDVFFFSWQARYYGVLFLLVTWGISLLLRFASPRPVTRRDYVWLFLVHLAMVYLHLYGLIYSGVLFLAMAITECLRGKLRWGLLGTVVAAWISFCAWLPATLQQLKSVGHGIYTPPNYLKLGFFVEELALQTPMALVLLFMGLLGALALLGGENLAVVQEARASRAPLGWAAMAVVTLGLLAVPISTWVASHFLIPPPYMRRYAFPCIAAWVLLVALLQMAIFRLPGLNPVSRRRLPAWGWTLACLGVLVFGIGYQPARARKNPPRPAVPFVDADFGHPNLPMVFENSWYFIPRVFYGTGRQYALLIDREAAEAATEWYTKNMYGFFQGWYPRYDKATIYQVEDLPAEFLACDDDYTRTFEWVFEHRPELSRELLATRKAELEIHGEERIWLVHNAKAKTH